MAYEPGDLAIKIDSYKLNIRAAGVIIHNNKILVHRNINSNHYALIGGRVEIGEDSETTVKREIMEELDTDIMVGDLIDTIEYDYPNFHLSMDCFLAEIVSGNLVLREHEAAKWLTKEKLDSVDWLPADITLIDKIRETM